MWINKTVKTKKTCSKCGVEKPIIDFYKHEKRNGRKPGLFSACKKCSNQAVKESTKKNPEIGIKARAWAAQDYRRNKRRYWASSTIRNHGLRGFVVEVKKEELTKKALGTDECFLCGAGLRWNREDGEPTMCNETPTLDRMDNEKTITINNVEIVCLLCNSTKRNRTFKEFVDYCKMISDKFGE